MISPSRFRVRRERLKPSAVGGLLLLVIITVVILFPVFIMLSTSLKALGEIYLFPPTIIPREIHFENYLNAVRKLDFLPYFRNSAFVSGCIVLGTLISSSLVAFGFTRYNVPGKKQLFLVVLSTLMIPYPSLMIPQFVLFNKLHWVDTYLPLIAPSFFGSAYMIFLLRQFFTSISNSLFDAAKIDGCSEFRSYWNIALPLCKPALATVAIFSFIWSWDDLLSPVIYLNTTSKYTLPLLLSSLQSKFTIPQWNTIMVAALLTALPCMLLFLFCQRYFVEGIVTTGMKD
jgi:multiple sugar transport system permease protein